MFSSEIYTARRAALRKKIKSGLILLPGNIDASINYPANAYGFRQDSNFLYYFGLAQPGFAGVIDVDRDTRRARITERLKQRLDAGMLDEIRRLLGEGIPADDLIYYGLEYKYLTQYVLGEYGYDEMFRKLETAIHQFAKRQMTWFRGMERRGITIHWLDAALPLGEKVEQVRRLCGGFSGANPCGE